MEGDPNVEISIVLCDAPFIHSLNNEHRGIDKPTDVLSFPQESDDFPAFDGIDVPRVLGDLVISLDTADRQAHAAGWSLADEVDLLAIHGVLHLLAYDDETVEGAAEMREKTAVVLSDLGIQLPAGSTHPYFIDHGATSELCD
jgi:probable rRNA maturation factor